MSHNHAAKFTVAVAANYLPIPRSLSQLSPSSWLHYSPSGFLKAFLLERDKREGLSRLRLIPREEMDKPRMGLVR